MAGVSRSFGDRMIETGGRTTGFDYLRVGLAFSVIFWHAFQVAYGPEVLDPLVSGPFRFIYVFILPAFFGLSGFLVAGSLERNTSLIRFASLRVIRIAPALAVEVVLSALILGTLLTTLPLAAYFSHPTFHVYFLNALGHIHFELPGVFETNPYEKVVNRQLWTIPFELRCYVLLAVAAALGLVRRRWLFLMFVVALHAYEIGTYLYENVGKELSYGGVSGWDLVLAFLDGVLIYRFRDAMPFTRPFYFASLAAACVLMNMPLGDFFMIPVVVYATAFTGLLNPRANFLVKFGDLSYGMYLYGFAIQQFVVTWGEWTRTWYWNLAFTMPIVALIACFSWYCIEKPALNLRKHLSVFDGLDRSITAVQNRLIAAAKAIGAPIIGRVRASPLAAKLFAES